MLVKVLSLSFNSNIGGFNDEEVRNFMVGKEILSVTDHFFIRNDIPYLTLVVKYFPYRQEAELKPVAAQVQTKKGDESWKEGLTDADMGLFNLFRDWRSQRCKKDGVPPYVLMTNKQMAEVVKLRPQSMAELMKVEGFGKAKAEKYGEEILKISKVDSVSPATPVSEPS